MSADKWVDVTLALMLVGQSVFVLSYFRFPWWDSALGRVLFGKAVTFTAALGVTYASRLFEWPHEAVYRSGLYAVLCLSIWVQVFVFWRAKQAVDQ